MLIDKLKGTKYSFSKYKMKDGRYKTRFYISPDTFYPIYLKHKQYSPSYIIMSLSKEARSEMFLAMLEADGSMRREKKRYDRFGGEKHSNKRVLEYFTLLSIAQGQPYTFHESLTKSGTPFINYQLLTEELLSNKNHRWQLRQEEEVWCPTTGTGTWVMEQDGWICVTGNCSNPNFQQFPKELEGFPSLRDCFIVDKGYKMIASDYSGQELRVLAQLTQEPGLIDVFNKGKDLHLATANEFFNLNIPESMLYDNHPQFNEMKELHKDARNRAKIINFGIAYGKGNFGFSQDFGISEAEAQEILDRYFKSFPRVKQAIDDTKREVQANGFVKTLTGRMRHFEMKESYGQRYYANSSFREAFNFKIQGFSADMIRLAAIKTFNTAKANPEWGMKMLMTVHDEIVYQVKEQYAEQARDAIKNDFEAAVKFVVPIVADVHIGSNYGGVK
jgi:hypothetical protein